jgi:hypothetical protein
MSKDDSIKKRLAKYSVPAASGCLEWHGYRDVYGYGILLVTANGKKANKKAHRIAYEQANGPIPNGMFVCHKCDNRACIEPSHLFLGTPADNNADMMRKGRYKPGGKPQPGSKNGRAKLNEQQVLGIRVLVKDFGISAAAIARSLTISPSAVQRASSGQRWLV